MQYNLTMHYSYSVMLWSVCFDLW